jgi:uncharacterized protein YjbI with pentapeptide repeats
LDKILSDHGDWVNSQYSRGEPAWLLGADLHNADLRNADLHGVNKKILFLGGAEPPAAVLNYADLRGAKLQGADFRGASLQGTKLTGESLYGVDLRDANLSNAMLDGAYLSGAQLNGANLSGAHLEGANLSGGGLNETFPGAADLRGARLNGAFLNRARLSWVNLDGVELGLAHLEDAYLDGTHLERASLPGAFLDRAILDGAHLEGADLRGAHLVGASLVGANLDRANLSGADLSGANLAGSHLTAAHLDEVSLRCVLIKTKFICANLDAADLNDTSLVKADLSAADLTNAELTNADFHFADLQGTFFEPKSNPEIRGIAAARHLQLLTYHQDTDALSQLRKRFQEDGFRKQERQLTYALNRAEAMRAGLVERWFKKIAFDWTCEYGMNPGRALQIWFGLLLLCGVTYIMFIHLPVESGIYRIFKLGEIGIERLVEIQIQLPGRSSEDGPPPGLARIEDELRLIFWAFFFSLMSAFNIGFRDINFGRWLRLLPRTEYDLRAKGWVRTLAGFQSLISVYLIAIWVLTYFGRPFE